MFNPYVQWLGLPPEIEKPNYFHILRVKSDVTDRELLAKAAQKATLKVKSHKPGEHSLEWTQLLGEIETARLALSDPGTRKAYIKRLLAEKKAREEEQANAVESSAFEEASDDESEAETHESYDDEPADDEDEDDPMAAWSAAYGSAKPATTARPAAGSKGVGSKGIGPKGIASKGIGPKGAAGVPAADEPGGPMQIRKAVKGRKKAGPLAYTAIAVVFLLAVGGAAFGGMMAFQMLGKDDAPSTDPEIAMRPPAKPSVVPPKTMDPVDTHTTGPETVATGAEEGGGFGRPMETEPIVEDPAMDPATTPDPSSADPFVAAMPAVDPELAAAAAPDDPFFVEPTLRKFGYEYDPEAAVSVAMTPAMTPAPEPTGRPLTDDEKAELNEAFSEIREMLVQRQVPQAQQRIAALSSKFEGSQASGRIEAVQILTQKFREFWIAVVTGSLRTTTGVPLDYSGTTFSLVEASSQLIVVRFAGENKRWAPTALPGGLAKYFAEAALNDGSANSEIVIGTIYALENGGAKADQAREYWLRAASAGEEETVQKLLPLLTEAGWSFQ